MPKIEDKLDQQYPSPRNKCLAIASYHNKKKPDMRFYMKLVR